MALKIKPLGDRVIVKPIESEDVTTGGIVIPDTAKEKPQRGKVLAVGPGEFDEEGECCPIGVEVDEVVLFAKYAGSKVKIEGEELLILSKDDILAIVEGESK